MADLTLSASATLADTITANPGFFTTSDARAVIVPAGNKLIFNPSNTVTLTIDNESLEIQGELEMKPASASVTHTINFTNINEALVCGSKAKPCSSATASGTSATFTVVLEPGQTSHNITTNDVLLTAGFSPAAYNTATGFDVTAVTATTVTATLGSAPGGPATTLGTIKPHDHQPTDNDKGLYITEAGVLDIVGTTRKAWTRAVAAVSGTDSTVQTADTLTGWQTGDTIVVCPTDDSYDHFDVVTVRAGTTGTTFNWTGTIAAGRHPYDELPDGSFTGAELLNITRNVVIKGQDATHRTHVMIHNHSAVDQQISYATFQHMGPRQNDGAGGTRKITGRWPVHFHKSETANAGSEMLGCVVTSAGSHAYVTHASDDITLTDCIAYDVAEFAYWWDFDTLADMPDGITWDRCVGAKILHVAGTADVHRLGVFQLHTMDVGLSSTIRDCVAVGNDSDGRDAAGFLWPEGGPNAQGTTATKEWTLEGRNVSHNNRVNGWFVWMNDAGRHYIPAPVAYRNGVNNFSFGAYQNVFQWTDIVAMGGGWRETGNFGELQLNPNGRLDVTGKPQLWTGKFDLLGEPRPWVRILRAALNPVDRPRITDCFINNPGTASLVIIDEPGQQPHWMDFVRCRVDDGAGGYRDLEPEDFEFLRVRENTRLRVQYIDDSGGFMLQAPPFEDDVTQLPDPAAGSTPSAVQTFTISAPFAFHVTTQSLSNGTAGSTYPSQTLTSSLGVGSVTWTVKEGSLPTGLSLSSAGVITGTPTATGTSTFTVEAEDSTQVTAIKELSITVTGTLTITTTSVPSGTTTVAYSTTLATTGASGAVTWSVVSGALPDGLTLGSSTGIISGTPTVANTFNFTVQATDAASSTDTQALSIVVVTLPATLTIDTTSLANGQVDVAYSQTVAASGGTTPYTFSVQSGSLPTGLSLAASTGIISGTPSTVTGSPFSFTIRVTDNAAATDDQAFVVTIAPAAVDLTITTSTLPDGVVGTAYAGATIQATGGTPPYVFSLASGSSLPAGLTMTSAGVISGTPTAAGNTSFTMRCQDASQPKNTTTKLLNITVVSALTLTTTSLPVGTDDREYTQVLSAINGTSPYTFSIFSGSLPTGLTLTGATGVIAGTPTTAGTYNFVARVTDNAAATDDQELSILITPVLAVTNTTLSGGQVSTAYNALTACTGGLPPYSWSIVATGGGGSGGGVGGELPPGLSISDVGDGSTGRISGTPTAAGFYPFTVRVIDSLDNADDQELTISISAAPASPIADTGARRVASLNLAGTGNAICSLDKG